MDTHNEPTPVSVALLAVPESSAAVLYGLHEVFACVGAAWEELTGEHVGGRRMHPRIVAESRSPLTAPIGVPITPHASFEEAANAHIVIVGDLAVNAETDPRGRWSAAVGWLRQRFAGGSMVCSVCTGSVMLAEAGLLDGLEATTHWGASRIFRKYYPAVRLRPDRILTPAGPEQRILTSGGAASWQDLALYLVARYCGRDEAVRTAKVFVFGDRNDGQLPFAAMARPRRHDDGVIAACQEWTADHYAVPNTVARMVERSGLAPRTFVRRFSAATGYTPLSYVQTLRIEEAKQLLETTDMPTSDVGAAVGYEDPASFRRIFKRMSGVTPARYRQRFRGIGALAAPRRDGESARSPTYD